MPPRGDVELEWSETDEQLGPAAADAEHARERQEMRRGNDA